MKKMGLILLLLAMTAVLAGCWNNDAAMPQNSPETNVLPTDMATDAPMNANPGTPTDAPMESGAGNIGETGVNPAATNAPLTEDGANS